MQGHVEDADQALACRRPPVTQGHVEDPRSSISMEKTPGQAVACKRPPVTHWHGKDPRSSSGMYKNPQPKSDTGRTHTKVPGRGFLGRSGPVRLKDRALNRSELKGLISKILNCFERNEGFRTVLLNRFPHHGM
eukprot:354250-Chlamydomonas_euryale.AAC.2